MAGLTDLTAQSIGAPDKFNWPWFIELCVCGILTLFFLFYFNRLFATVVSYAARAYAWHHYRIWVDIQAVQISLLGGRIFFKGIRYHGENETVFIQHGYVTWRYWFRNVRQVDLTIDEDQPGYSEEASSSKGDSGPSMSRVTTAEDECRSPKKQANSEARLAVFVTGLEWFVYNQTPLYDAILRDDSKADNKGHSVAGSSTGIASSEALKLHLRSKLRRRPKSDETSSAESSKSQTIDPEKDMLGTRDRAASIERQSTTDTESATQETDVNAFQSLFVQLLPVYIECSRAAISIGNEHTKAIVVTTVSKAKGHVDARGCGPHDLFRQVFEFDVDHPVVQMRPNPDFIGNQLTVAERIIVASDPLSNKSPWWRPNLNIRRHKHDAIHALRELVPGLQSSVESLRHGRQYKNTRVSYLPFAEDDTDGGHWHGLSRYLDENDADDHRAWSTIDYARFSTILDCPGVRFTFYWDSPGQVKPEHFDPGEAATVDKVTGVAAPAYGMELVIRGGEVNYGPWADRLRAEIQAVFFPASYKSSTPTPPLEIGAWRRSTKMAIRVDIEEEVTMRVPTRESSKDSRWRGRATAVRDAAALKRQREKHHFRHRRAPKTLLGPDIRPFGWISFSVDANSTVHYDMDLVADHQGYQNQLFLDLRNTKATSSVNHADLWRCQNQRLQCDLSNPLGWNSQHTWHFDIQSHSMDMFLLRDHMFLLTDLIGDFTAGQKSDYMTFVPFEYKINLRFDDLKLFLNANDFNIIDAPCDLDSNAFLILGMRKLEGKVDIPMLHFSPAQSSVIFKANGSNLFLDLKTPAWNTLRSFSKDENMATLTSLGLGGSYNYYASTSNKLTDSLFMEIVGGSPKFHLNGFLIRYFMNVKENYFGEDLHFRTLEEYQSSLSPDNRLIVEDQRRQVKQENDLDVILNVRAEEACVLMPTNIYDRRENLRVDVMLVEADMRFSNYYMDLQVNTSPIEVSVQEHIPQGDRIRKETSNCQLYISAASVYGHRLFGAPPTEPTYVCNWDFDIGSITGECSTKFMRVLVTAILSLVFTLDDDENALPITRITNIFDVTFLRARVDGIQIWLMSHLVAFLVETGSLSISFNDWAGRQFSQNIRANVPSVVLAAVDSQGALLRQEKSKKGAHTLACVQTSIQLASMNKKAEFKYQRDLQQNHIKFHDLRTNRTDFLIHEHKPLNVPAKEVEWSRDPSAMPTPDLPAPCSHQFRPVSPQLNLKARRRPQHKRSFMSSHSQDSHHELSQGAGPQSAFTNMYSAVNSNTSARAQNPPSSGYEPHTRKLDRRGDSFKKDASFSSPWLEPHFVMQRVNLDLSHMPTLDLGPKSESLPHSAEPEDYNSADESLPHDGTFCHLPTGVKAFCLPSLFPAIVDLLQDLTPRDPVSLLDMIQRSTVANVKETSVERQGKKLDFAVRIPVAAVRLVNQVSRTQQVTDLSADQYNLVISHIRLTGRTAPTVAKQSHGQTQRDILLLQAAIHDIDFCVEERFRSEIGDVARLRTSIRDSGFWLSLQDEIRTKVQVGAVEVSTGGGTVDRLSMLFERSRAMITDITKEFERFSPAMRIQNLLHFLTQSSDDEAIPAFMSRPSYVLRSADEHVRLTDSWKIVARFRQRLISLSADDLTKFAQHLPCMAIEQREMAQRQILDRINGWKSWDRAQEACQPLLVAVFGTSNKASGKLPKVDDIEASVYLEQVSMVLDPGPQQSELILQSGDLSVSQKPVFEQLSGDDLAASTTKPQIRVQTWFAAAALNLNWNLIELSKSLVKQINTTDPAPKSQEECSPPKEEKPNSDLDLMVVAGSDSATATIRTINMNIYMEARKLESSLASQPTDSFVRTSLLLAASSAQLRVASQYKKLFSFKLESPSTYGLYKKAVQRSNRADTARFAACCDQLRFNMKEDVLNVLEVVDVVIKNEVIIIQEIINSGVRPTVQPASKPASTSVKLEDVHVAFFLNDYRLQFRLFPSLRYSIVGMVARTMIVPRGESVYAVHVDVKKHKHILVGPNRKARYSAAALEIPPINARVVIGIGKDRVRVEARSTLERVKVEADAVQACIETAYQPQNKQHLKSMKALIDRIQTSIKRMDKPPAPKEVVTIPTTTSSMTLLYTAHSVFEGFEVHCSAPSANGEEHRADLKFGLRETSLRIHNHNATRNEVYDQPQFELHQRQVFVELYRNAGYGTRNYGRFGVGLKLTGTTQIDPDGVQIRNYEAHSHRMQLDLFTETAALVVDMAAFLQNRITQITTLEDRKKIRPLRRLTLVNNDLSSSLPEISEEQGPASDLASNLLDTTFVLDLNAIQVRWIIGQDIQAGAGYIPEDMVFSIKQIDLRTQREGSARLTILDMQLQTVSKQQDDPLERTANSALLPEMIFSAAHFATRRDRRFAFQAAGKALDLRLAADGILPLSAIKKSLVQASIELQKAKAFQSDQSQSSESVETSTTKLLGNKRLASLLVDADFAGAIVTITPRTEKKETQRNSAFTLLKGPRRSRAGRYGQAVQNDGVEQAVLRAPGIAVKVEYLDTLKADPSLSTELKVAASSNTLAPSVVPLVMEIYSSVKEIMGENNSTPSKPESKIDLKLPASKYLSDTSGPDTDPTAILGRVRLTAALWVQRQEFSLTCQPIARVAATAKFDDIFITINTVQDNEHDRFFSIITTFNNLQTSVQHIYSRDSTANFEVESIVISLMNSRHVSAKTGVSAILNVSPIKGTLNVKQMQDFLLFREIWYPAELRHQPKQPTAPQPATESQAYAMQKYHELASTAALPWHAVVSIQQLKLDVDFGQSLAKSSFVISKLWASSKKNSDSEQNLCIGFDRIGIDSQGRMSGFIELSHFHARTSIRWPFSKGSGARAPLVQASIGFKHLRLKTAFDYQPFAVADVSSFEFLMYNVRPTQHGGSDRLVGILDGGKVQVFCISAAAAQALSIVQAFERLFQEKREAFQDSLQELDSLLRRKSIFPSNPTTSNVSLDTEPRVKSEKKESHVLHTDVVVTLKAIDIGAFHNSFFDNQILKVEAEDAKAQFAVATVEGKIRSGLGMTLGQVRVALSAVSRPNTKALGEVEIAEVIERATSSRGGTILKVPRLVASMQTWQQPHAHVIEYVFRSTFQGKVDVGWNYSRIRFIRGMWDTHSQALTHRLGKPLPPSAVKITTEAQEDAQGSKQEKITAVVNVPQSSKFKYVALEPPIIDTPQLRDMGEATPPLEWIGLHRDKLPNVTHSIVIVTLLEVAKEVEDAYTKILGTG